jgi:adenylosuccinate lyase
MLTAISPLDGRYQATTSTLSEYFSEYALIHYRVKVEIEYLKFLIQIPLPELQEIHNDTTISLLNEIVANFSLQDAEKIKNTEKVTNHDVKAVEYFIKEALDTKGLSEYREFVHFGLTSQDINNTAFPLMMKDALNAVMIPKLYLVLEGIKHKTKEYHGVPMLARTHGQAASPTTLGKEISVFIERLEDEMMSLKNQKIKCKFGGATGNFNAHKVSYPNIDWPSFADQFTSDLGLHRSKFTTQIAHYDDVAAMSHQWIRINTILSDLCKDIWTYVSMDYFKQKTKAGEIGSSAMPHKVNPIDFENAEGNLGMANAIFGYLAEKLPVSRLQRDLTDSTVLRNLGVPFGHSLIAYTSIVKGLDKLVLNEQALHDDLDKNWAVVAEAIQNILRREKYPEPYEALKELTRGKAGITKDDIHHFIATLGISTAVKNELLAITPFNYVGYF